MQIVDRQTKLSLTKSFMQIVDRQTKLSLTKSLLQIVDRHANCRSTCKLSIDKQICRWQNHYCKLSIDKQFVADKIGTANSDLIISLMSVDTICVQMVAVCCRSPFWTCMIERALALQKSNLKKKVNKIGKETVMKFVKWTQKCDINLLI